MLVETLKLYEIDFPKVTFNYETTSVLDTGLDRVEFFGTCIQCDSYADRAVAYAAFRTNRNANLSLFLPSTYVCAVDTEDAVRFVKSFAKYEAWEDKMYDGVVTAIHNCSAKRITPSAYQPDELTDIIPHRTKSVVERLVEENNETAAPSHILRKELNERTAPQLLHDLKLVAQTPKSLKRRLARRLHVLLK